MTDLPEEAVPTWRAPTLATLTERRFSDPGWIFERKLDGVRCLAFRDGEPVRLLSRNRRPLNGTYPELVDALTAQRTSRFVVDGEVVAFEGRRTSVVTYLPDDVETACQPLKLLGAPSHMFARIYAH